MSSSISLLGLFARHRVAANLLMAMMLLSGYIALQKLNVQFFPNFCASPAPAGADADLVEFEVGKKLYIQFLQRDVTG